MCFQFSYEKLRFKQRQHEPEIEEIIYYTKDYSL